MRLVKAKVLGFCMGVRRAVDMAADIRAENPEKSVYTMGPLIHNPQVQLKLKEKGIKILSEDDLPFSLENSTVVIRAHGISPALETELKKRGAVIADATCPHVKASQKKAQSLSAGGFRIFLAGEKNHGEIIGIASYAGEGCFVAASPTEAEHLAAELFQKEPGAKTALLGQTTISPSEYRAIAGAILKYFPHLEIVDSICGATQDRQDSLRELCAAVDAVLIAGGRESANTRRLLSIAEGCGKKAWLVESAAEIPPEIRSFPVVGLSAGASTPEDTIDEIEDAILRMA
ncbi:4-hydroxy-3-methylbut-2-enyl diphosphate reductase [Spirochaetia bacterium]|nr:4-hydroxy-3-methylbut-2-enyl diphosphate reductase [Spirochaetia bacterium]